MCAQGGSFPQLLREMPTGRARLASRPQPGASIARPPTYRGSAARSGETFSPTPRRLRPRLPSPTAAEDEGAGAHPHGQVKAPHRAPLPAGPVASPGLSRENRRDAENGGDNEGVNPAEESCCCCCRHLPRSPPRPLHNSHTQQGRAQRAPPVGAGHWSRGSSGHHQPLLPWRLRYPNRNILASALTRREGARKTPPTPPERGAHSPPAVEWRQVPSAQAATAPVSGATESPCEAGAAAPASSALAAQALANVRHRLPAPPPLASIGREGCPARGRSRPPRSLR